MGNVWFCLVALMLTAYVVLDGFDLGAGAIHLFVARTNDERRILLRTIGPVWDGNEVWLIAAGGTIYFAFPLLYASSFSGFYLPLMIVLWLLILRGISVEFRSHVASNVWAAFWDVVFCLASLLLAIFFGAALGNVIRGVPLDAQGRFFEPLWTNFRLGADNGILDWFTILAGVAALAALVMHGALWVALKSDGELNLRARTVAGGAWFAVAAMTLLVTVATFLVQPHVPASLRAHRWGYIFPVLALAGLFGVARFILRKKEGAAFASSCAYLVGMLTSAAFGIHPDVLPATNPAFSLTIANSKAQDYGLRIGFIWWSIGMALAISYTVFTYRRFAGKLAPPSEEEGY